MSRKTIYTLVWAGMALIAVAATVKISEYPAVTTPADADKFLLASGSTNKHVTYANLKTAINTGQATAAQLISATNLAVQTATNSAKSYGDATFQPILANPLTNGHTDAITLNNDLTVNGTFTVNSTEATTTVSNLTVNGTVTSTNLAAVYATKAEQVSGTNLIYSAGTAYTDAKVNGWTTNASNLGVITAGQFTHTNLTGDITIAGIAGLDLNKWQNAALGATNGHASENYKVTLPASVFLATNSFCIGQDVWVTNRSEVEIAFSIRNGRTNAAAVRYPQK